MSFAVIFNRAPDHSAALGRRLAAGRASRAVVGGQLALIVESDAVSVAEADTPAGAAGGDWAAGRVRLDGGEDLRRALKPHGIELAD